MATTMSDKNALALLRLLGVYAAYHGADCDGDITVKQLADDLVESNYDPRQLAEAEELRDAIYDGLNQ